VCDLSTWWHLVWSGPCPALPEEYDKVRWERMVADKAAGKPVITDPKKV